MRLNVQHIFLALCKKNTNCFRFVWVPSHIWFYIIYVLAFPLVICHIHNKITLNETKACMQTSFDWELKIHTQIFCATGSHEEMKSTKNIQRSLEKEWWKNSNAFPWSIFSNNFQEKCVSNSTSKSDPLILRIRLTNAQKVCICYGNSWDIECQVRIDVFPMASLSNFGARYKMCHSECKTMPEIINK